MAGVQRVKEVPHYLADCDGACMQRDHVVQRAFVAAADGGFYPWDLLGETETPERRGMFADFMNARAASWVPESHMRNEDD
jgi:hypothetical protein